MCVCVVVVFLFVFFVFFFGGERDSMALLLHVKVN